MRFWELLEAKLSIDKQITPRKLKVMQHSQPASQWAGCTLHPLSFSVSSRKGSLSLLVGKSLASLLLELGFHSKISSDYPTSIAVLV